MTGRTIRSRDSSTAAAAAAADAVGESRLTGVAEEGDLSAANSKLSGGGRIFSRLRLQQDTCQ